MIGAYTSVSETNNSFKRKIETYKFNWNDKVREKFYGRYCYPVIKDVQHYSSFAQNKIQLLNDILNEMQTIYSKHNY